MKLKSQNKEKRTLINVLVTKEERAAIEARAKRFAKGNVSAWVRYAAGQMTPPKKDLVS